MVELTPNHGRKYKSWQEVKAAWRAGHSFLAINGSAVEAYLTSPDTTYSIKYGRGKTVKVTGLRDW